MSQTRPSLLVLGWGNRGRGDDALGPMCLDKLREQLPVLCQERIELLEDHQLQIEHALDLLGRQRVLMIDACRTGLAPFHTMRVQAARDGSYTSHALAPATLLQIYGEVYGAAPETTLLAIRGESYELGQDLSDAAQHNLVLACQWAKAWCGAGD